ncbi:hypothetical protein ACFQ14_14815 [Pseudahrensia aquimaris]|uniref:Uncharacterized protein n=1 Tax=Pseudahrensia aquimaris TaxID=744461 RepID=A0ABW3FGP3_9HYPH
MRFYLAIVLSAFFGLQSINIAAASSLDMSGILIFQGTIFARSVFMRWATFGTGIIAVLFFFAMKYQDRLNAKYAQKYDQHVEEVNKDKKRRDRVDMVLRNGKQEKPCYVVYPCGRVESPQEAEIRIAKAKAMAKPRKKGFSSRA